MYSRFCDNATVLHKRLGWHVKRLKSFLPILGPGVFAVGYTIGIGSVTAKAKAGDGTGRVRR